MNYTFFDKSTGEILGTGGGSGVDVLSLNTQGRVEGIIDARNFYIDLASNQPVAKVKDPSTPFVKYKFDWTNKTWMVDIETSKQLARTFRSTLLADIDRVNAVWYNSLSDQQRNELQVYRQALLDVPQQTGFPESVTWPTKPNWL